MDYKTLELFQSFSGYYLSQSEQRALLNVNFDRNLNISTSVYSYCTAKQGKMEFIGEFNFNTLVYKHTIIKNSENIIKKDESEFDFDTNDNTIYLRYLNWEEKSQLLENKLTMFKKQAGKDRFIMNVFDKIPYSTFFSINANLLLG
jgi:hypothetical protein